jgi:P pilus assembly chaperone PapD
MRTNTQLIKIIACLCILLNTTDSHAQGNLLISPRRVVFEGSKKTQELNLANTGVDTAKYVVSLVQMRMKEDGNFEQIEKPEAGQNFANDYLRIFPRTVTLAPNEAQVIKIQVIKGNEMALGEYRSHLYFRAVPKSKPLGEGDAASDSGNIKVSLTPVFGITVPVIIRNGESNTLVSMSNLALNMKNTTPQLSMTLSRTGNMSAYGDVIVDHVTADGKATQVGIAKGVAIYTPNSMRTFNMELEKMPADGIHTGKLQVKYVQQTEKRSKGNSGVMAESSLTLN